MPSASYSFLDVVVLDEVRERFASGDAIVILSEDLEDVIWANGPGARLFGHRAIDAIIGASSGLGPVTKRQIKATSGFPAIGRDRSVLARMATGDALMFLASALVLPDGEQAILLASTASGERAGKAAAEQALTGFSEAGQYVAFVDAEGSIEAASPGFTRLGLTQDVLSELIGRLASGESRIAKRMLAGTRGPLPAGLARLTESPARHLLVVIDENHADADDSAATADDAVSAVPTVDQAGETPVAEAAPAVAEEAPIAQQASEHGASHLVEAGIDEVADQLAWDDAGLPIDAPPASAAAMPVTDSAADTGHDSWYFSTPGAEHSASGIDANDSGPLSVLEDQGELSLETGDVENSLDAVPVEDLRGDSQDEVPGQPSDTQTVSAQDEGVEPVSLEAPVEAEAPGADATVDADAQPPADDVQPDAAPVAAKSAVQAVERITSPVRFVWRTDGEGRFSQVSPEFAKAVGAEAADIVGRRFEDVALAFGLDPSDEIAGLLARRDTWSGRSVFWPVAGTDLKIPVDLAALPVYSRSRVFEGFRGFGVARGGDAVTDTERLGLALVPGNAPEAAADARIADVSAELPSSVDEASADPFQGEVPALTIAPMPDRRFADKVIRLAEHRPPANDKGLTSGERIAFQQIGERLKKDAGDKPVAAVEELSSQPVISAAETSAESAEFFVASEASIASDSVAPVPEPANVDDVTLAAAVLDSGIASDEPTQATPAASAAELPGGGEPVEDRIAEQPLADSLGFDDAPAGEPIASDWQPDAHEELLEPAEPASEASTGQASLAEAESVMQPADVEATEPEPVARDDAAERAPRVEPSAPVHRPVRSGLSLINFSDWQNDNFASDESASSEAGAFAPAETRDDSQGSEPPAPVDANQTDSVAAQEPEIAVATVTQDLVAPPAEILEEHRSYDSEVVQSAETDDRHSLANQVAESLVEASRAGLVATTVDDVPDLAATLGTPQDIANLGNSPSEAEAQPLGAAVPAAELMEADPQPDTLFDHHERPQPLEREEAEAEPVARGEEALQAEIFEEHRSDQTDAAQSAETDERHSLAHQVLENLVDASGAGLVARTVDDIADINTTTGTPQDIADLGNSPGEAEAPPLGATVAAAELIEADPQPDTLFDQHERPQLLEREEAAAELLARNEEAPPAEIVDNVTAELANPQTDAADKPEANSSPAPAVSYAAPLLEAEEPVLVRSQTGGDTTILEKLPVPVLLHSGDILHYANTEFLALTGYDSIDDLAQAGGIGALFADPYEGEDDEDRTDRQLRLRKKDGEEFPVEAFLRSVPWGDGKALLLVLSRIKDGSFGAASAQSPLIAELEARVAEMRTIIDTATDGVVLIARDGTVRSISRPAEALFGFDSDDVAGKPFAALFAIESQRAARDYLTGLSDNGVASVLNDGREVIGREAQGRFIPLFMTIGRLPSDSGFCAVVRDITQWKRAEEELTQARSVAERASSHKTDFLARVSHEIRTPLNAIIGFSELMIDEKFGPVTNDRYRDYLRDINRSGNHVLDLVNDLLDISKIEAGQQDMAYEAVSLNDTLAETVAMMQPQANRERVIIRSSFASKLPDVVADLRSVRQIALNILSNAVRYTQAGGQVIVSTAYETSGDVAMRVRDTGIGMTQAEIEQALKPFKQINSLKRARGDGTGLGLPLTKAMVEANRAKFVIHSTPGEGTLVEITFPSTRVLAD